MIIRIRTKTAPTSSSREIQDNLLKIKYLVNQKLPQCKVWLLTPALTTDNGKTTLTLTVSQLLNQLSKDERCSSIIECNELGCLLKEKHRKRQIW